MLFTASSSPIHSAPGSISVAAAVPGTVPDALHAAGLIGDPVYGRNSDIVIGLMTADNFSYTKQFLTPAACAATTTRCELVLEGVDTAATVSLNGNVLGQTENMHLRYVFDMTSALHRSSGTDGDGDGDGDTHNVLTISIESATSYAARVAADHGDPNCTVNRGPTWPAKFGHGTICSPYIRKNTGSFGWDCARAFVAQGVWKRLVQKSDTLFSFVSRVPPLPPSLAAGACCCICPLTYALLMTSTVCGSGLCQSLLSTWLCL